MIRTLTVSEVAERLGLSLSETKKVVNQFNFPKIKVGPRTIIIPEETFERWLYYSFNEEWKPLIYGDIDLTNRYEVSSCGRLRRISDGYVLKQHQNQRGYMVICISFDNPKKKVLKMHRAVAYTFIDNPYGYPVVNHMDGDKTNNHVNNLEWCTIQDNVARAIRTGLFKPGSYRHSDKKEE